MTEKDLLECPKVIKNFLFYLQTIKGRSQKTVNEYYVDLRTFFRYIKFKKGIVDKKISFENIKISDVDLAFIKTITLIDVFEYMNYLISEKNNNAATRSRKTCSLRMFFKFLTEKTHELEVNPVEQLETPKVKKSLPKFLTLDESKKLLDTILEGDNAGKFKERDFCIVTLLLNCGMRLSELVGINIDDIRENDTLKLTGKGNKERIIYINNACKKAIEDYKSVRPKTALLDKKAFFLSKDTRRLSPKTVQYLVNKYLKLAGFSGYGYSVHKLRHTAATLMYQYGKVDIRILKDILGHENLGTTEIYTHLSQSQMQNALESNPLNLD